MPDVQLLPKWVMVRYLMLWKEFEDRKFDSADAWEVLRKLPKPDNRKTVALFLSELRKAGWLQVEFDRTIPEGESINFGHMRTCST